MVQENLIAHAEIVVNAPANRVWDALVNPDMIKQYMFGTTIHTDWKKGSKITWSGEWKGKRYEDKGEVLAIEPGKKLQYSHFSPMTGEEDKPENYHRVTIQLEPRGNQTKVSLDQDKNKTEKGRDESEKNWVAMLQSLKSVIEKNN